jgi:hypothetical protein
MESILQELDVADVLISIINQYATSTELIHGKAKDRNTWNLPFNIYMNRRRFKPTSISVELCLNYGFGFISAMMDSSGDVWTTWVAENGQLVMLSERRQGLCFFRFIPAGIMTPRKFGKSF